MQAPCIVTGMGAAGSYIAHDMMQGARNAHYGVREVLQIMILSCRGMPYIRPEVNAGPSRL